MIGLARRSIARYSPGMTTSAQPQRADSVRNQPQRHGHRHEIQTSRISREKSWRRRDHHVVTVIAHFARKTGLSQHKKSTASALPGFPAEAAQL
jgi:hypothetical protein